MFHIAKGKLLCLNYLTGELLWSVKLERVGDIPNLLVYAGCVIVTGIGEATSFALDDGRQLWHDKFKGYGIHGGAMAAPGVASPIQDTKGD